MNLFCKTLTATICFALGPVALAEAPAEPDTSSWKCEFCPFAAGYDADYKAGMSYVSDDAAAFGDANGYNEKGAYVNLDGKGSMAAEDYRARWAVEDLGLDSRRIAFSGGDQGRYDYYVGYQQLPRHRYDTTATIFGQSGPDALALPSDWE